MLVIVALIYVLFLVNLKINFCLPTMAFQSQLIFPVKKRSSVSVKKIFDAKTVKASAKRVLFGGTATSLSPSKKARQDENNENFRCVKDKKNIQISSPLAIAAKKAFHTCQSSNLVGRSEEIAKIDTFISEHVSKQKAGSMYISGAPGTGKTTCLMSVIKSWEKKISFAFVNCMSVSNPSDIYKSIGKALKLSPKLINSKNIIKALVKYIVSSDTMIVLVLDEIDHLDNKGQEVLYSLFEWPQLPESALILIGIANALDLTDRVLPRLQAFKYEPKLMHFQPYTREQIISILEDRLSDLQNSATNIKPLALQLCARKIATCTGDIRKALDVCRRAVEMVEKKLRKQLVLQSTSDDRANPGSPMKKVIEFCVDVHDINAVLQEIFGSQLQTLQAATTITLPLQQMILLCTLILMKKHCKIQDINFGKLYDIYKRVCRKRDIIPVNECEFHGLCKLVETRGFIQLKPSKIVRIAKIVLNIDESEAEFILKDHAMLPAILSDKSVLSSC